MTRWILVVLLSLMAPTLVQAANELRCNELGANCIASEPLNTNSYGYDGSGNNPADTTGSDKQMTFEGGTGNVIVNSSAVNMGSNWSYPSSGALFTALPNHSSSLNFVLQGTPEPSDVNFLGHVFNGSNPTGRRAFRWYQYFSPTWQTTGGGCANRGKIFELGGNGGPMVFTTNGHHQIYGFTPNWNIAPFDCCNGGPGSQEFAFDTSTVGGKWWRFELVVRNALPTGGVTIVELWRKNVTNNGPDTKVLDTADTSYGPGSGGANWTNAQATSLKPKNRLDDFLITPWGNGTCAGYVAYSHLLAAAWSTDAGQRIGAASELEGGGGSPPDTIAPPAPTNLRVSQLEVRP